ncbi:hypothetical protein QEJ31_11185 [Pigmentibacter sp. JX0631]|uniref:hypothetical protein n=1 Tax=Pigmentibacter sp. JX0631 TaxID=2976982 RepID=UPI00246897AA|nr:hypothetical protein [Pigmentibacter sp. JX0631]WGL59083.1 hypothetical protein QEJ31_11185 [Pigmentibacter sp. JX0631]
MKNILFLENSLALQKALKLILANEKIYNINVVSNPKNFDLIVSKEKFDLLIVNSKFYNLLEKKKIENQTVLLIYENKQEIEHITKKNKYFFLQKPFASSEWKKVIDDILDIHEIKETEAIHIDIKSTEIENYMKEIIDKWVKEQAPKYAKDVIREELLKLIS